MGGLIVSEYMIDHSGEIDGAIISAPLIMIPENINKITVITGKIFSKIAPKIGITGVNANAISRDLEVVNAYIKDPLVLHRKTTARLSVELFGAIIRVNAEIEKITAPFLVLQGSEDKLVNPQGAKMLYHRADSKRKTLKIYDGLYHEVFNEPEKEQVLNDVASWLDLQV